MRTWMMGVAAGVLASCTVKAKLELEDLEAQVASLLESQGLDAVVHCPAKIKVKAGETFTCKADHGTVTYEVRVTIEKIEGSRVALDADLVGAVRREAVVAAITKIATEELGVPPTINCGDEVVVRVADSKVTCAAEVAGHKGRLEVRLAADQETLDGYTITFDEGPALVRKKVLEIVGPSIESELGVKPTLDCGEEPILFANDGIIPCKVTIGGATRDLEVIVDGDKIDRWRISEVPGK